MCQAHVLRFRCGHALLMAFETCRVAPCPNLKIIGGRSQQPGKCYNCEYRRASNLRRPTTRDSACDTTFGRLVSHSSDLSSSPPLTLTRAATAPLPFTSLQPMGTVQYCTSSAISQHRPLSGRRFSFSCPSSCSHNTLPHYNMLPSHIPHQSHPCPPCQISELQTQGDKEAISSAKSQFPHLTSDMLVRNGRVRENWESELTLDKFIAEKRTEEKQMWCFVVRKWTQDLKKGRVLVAEEDGMGLFQ